MKHLFRLSLCTLILSVFSTPVFAQDFFTTGQPTVTPEGSNYTVSFSFDTTKHGITSPIPFSAISVSGGVYIKTNNERIISISPKQPDSMGLFRHAIPSGGLNPNTEYEVRLSFSGNGKTETVTPFVFTTQKTATPTAKPKNDPNEYELLAKLPGLTRILDPVACQEAQAQNPGEICDINGFINFMLQLIIGICAVVLVVRLIIAGYAYMTTDVAFVKMGAKNTFTDALIGLLVALSSYLILNTINPRLVKNSFSIDGVNFEVEQFSEIDAGTYQSITGQAIKPKKDYLLLVEKISAQNQIDACIVKATITVESAWKPNIIGCDENARKSDVPSRKAFIQSGIKLDGTKFSERDITASVFNTCPKNIDASKPGYGLDWRFSKGGGLMQKTLFPENYNTTAWFEGVKEGGLYWNRRNTPFNGFKDLITPEKNIQLGIDILKDNLKVCGSIEKAYRRYGSGNCNGSGALLNTSVAKKMTEYQVCKNGAPQYKP